MGMNNIQQLTNILESINPYLGAGGGQPQASQVDPSQYMGNAANAAASGNQGFGGTFFTQDANNGGYYSSNGHTFNIQGPSGGSIHVAMDENGHAYYVDGGEDELLGEFPQDLDEEAYDE